MKITCDREKLLALFQTAATVTPARTPKPILQRIKLDVHERTILTATDLEVGIRIEVPGIEVETPGSVVLPVQRFGSILRESFDEKLRIESDHRGTTVRGERSEFRLLGENPDEFPEMAEFSAERYLQLPVRLFKELIRRTLFATDTDSSRYALGGVLLEFETGHVTAVGTDGRRLAKMEGPVQEVGGPVSVDAMTIVPARSMQLMERAFVELEGEVQLAIHTNDLLARAGQTTIFTRLVEGRFPRWRDVLPGVREGVRIELAAGPFYSAVRQAAIVASEESRGLDLTFGGGTLVVTGAAAETGQSRVELPVNYDGQPVTVSLDHRYVADFLRVLDPEKTVTVDITDEESAAFFTTDDGYGYVVMPMARKQ
jgi:DNA polymerase-3 subunit beta